MPTQKRETGKNYIGLLSEEYDAQCAAEAQSAPNRRMKEYVVGLIAAMFNRCRRETR
jgi:hypothetical protein